MNFRPDYFKARLAFDYATQYEGLAGYPALILNYLITKWNAAKRPAIVHVSSSELLSAMECNRKNTAIDALDRLEKKGYIKINSKAKTMYDKTEIMLLFTEIEGSKGEVRFTVIDTASDTHNDTAGDTAGDTVSDTVEHSVYMNARANEKIREDNINIYLAKTVASEVSPSPSSLSLENKLRKPAEMETQKPIKTTTKQNDIIPESRQTVTELFIETKPTPQTLEISAINAVGLNENEKLIQTTTSLETTHKTPAKRKNVKPKSDDLATRIAASIFTEFIRFYHDEFYPVAFNYKYEILASQRQKEFANCKRFLIKMAENIIDGNKQSTEERLGELTMIACKNYLKKAIETGLKNGFSTYSMLLKSIDWAPNRIKQKEYEAVK